MHGATYGQALTNGWISLIQWMMIHTFAKRKICLIRIFSFTTNFLSAKQGQSTGPKLRLIYPYDAGVFLYCRREGDVPIVSNLQAYLDLYARGGRDLKQADYLLSSAIEPRWRAA